MHIFILYAKLSSTADYIIYTSKKRAIYTYDYVPSSINTHPHTQRHLFHKPNSGCSMLAHYPAYMYINARIHVQRSASTLTFTLTLPLTRSLVLFLSPPSEWMHKQYTVSYTRIECYKSDFSENKKEQRIFLWPSLSHSRSVSLHVLIINAQPYLNVGNSTWFGSFFPSCIWLPVISTSIRQQNEKKKKLAVALDWATARRK